MKLTVRAREGFCAVVISGGRGRGDSEKRGEVGEEEKSEKRGGEREKVKMKGGSILH